MRVPEECPTAHLPIHCPRFPLSGRTSPTARQLRAVEGRGSARVRRPRSPGWPAPMTGHAEGRGAVARTGRGGDRGSGGRRWGRSNTSHNAYRTGDAEVGADDGIGDGCPVHYRWHPLHGRRVVVELRQRVRGEEVVRIERLPGMPRDLPGWMMDAAACATMQVGPACVSVEALLDLRAVLSAIVLARASEAEAGSVQHEEDGQHEDKATAKQKARAGDAVRAARDDHDDGARSGVDESDRRRGRGAAAGGRSSGSSESKRGQRRRAGR